MKEALNIALDAATAYELITFMSSDHIEAVAAIREKTGTEVLAFADPWSHSRGPRRAAMASSRTVFHVPPVGVVQVRTVDGGPIRRHPRRTRRYRQGRGRPSFDPRKRHSSGCGRAAAEEAPHRGTGEGSAAATADPVPMALVAVPAGEGSGEETADRGRLPGWQRRPGSREIPVALSEKAYRLLEAARADNPGTSYGDLIAAALVRVKPTVLAERPTPPEDPLLRPLRTQRLHVEGRTRSRPFNVTPGQADAIPALADEVGIPNLSGLVDRAVVLTYETVVAGDG